MRYAQHIFDEAGEVECVPLRDAALHVPPLLYDVGMRGRDLAWSFVNEMDLITESKSAKEMANEKG